MSGIGSQSYFSIETFRKFEGPILDVRSPSEYEQGHWPGSINLPLFTNQERAEVGKTYKEKGRRKAILIGLEFIGPKLLKIRQSLEDCYKSKPIGARSGENFLRLYCWRGGMRSASLGWLASICGFKTIILEGGYKSYRKWVLKKFELDQNLRLIGGQTGTGKTELLLALANTGVAVIDLEGLASHRGSSFGGLGLKPQPSSEQFENLLAEKLEIHSNNKSKGIWLEAESANLGRCRIPHQLFKQMMSAPLIVINRSKEERVEHLVTIYGMQNKEALKEATERIKKRLGPQRTAEALEAIRQEEWSKACIAMLDYYDRCYQHEIKKSPRRKNVDVSGLNPEQAAADLVKKGLII